MYIALIVILVALVLFWASFSISAGVYISSFCRNPRAGRVVALTFDDGVDPHYTPLVLDVLKKYSVKATFFVIGQKAEQHPEILSRIIAEGHAVGNHTYSHEGHFPMKSTRAMVADLSRAEQAIGLDLRYFRPPFGVTNPMVSRAVRKAGYRSVGWSIRSLDTMKFSRERVLNRVISRLHNGGIILLHDNRAQADVLLENIIIQTLSRGYKIVTVEELMQ